MGLGAWWARGKRLCWVPTCATPVLVDVQVAYLEAVIDVDGDRLISAEEILEAFKQVRRHASCAQQI